MFDEGISTSVCSPGTLSRKFFSISRRPYWLQAAFAVTVATSHLFLLECGRLLNPLLRPHLLFNLRLHLTLVVESMLLQILRRLVSLRSLSNPSNITQDMLKSVRRARASPLETINLSYSAMICRGLPPGLFPLLMPKRTSAANLRASALFAGRSDARLIGQTPFPLVFAGAFFTLAGFSVVEASFLILVFAALAGLSGSAMLLEADSVRNGLCLTILFPSRQQEICF